MTEQSRDPELLARYASRPEQLRAALAGLSEADLDVARSADTWTIRQIVHHLADGDDIWKVCIKAALGNSNGVFSLQWYWDIPQDEWVKSWSYAGRAIEPSLALFEANCRHVVPLLQHTPDALERTIRLRRPDGQEPPVPVRWVVEMQTRHAADHIHEIQAIRQAHGL